MRTSVRFFFCAFPPAKPLLRGLLTLNFPAPVDVYDVPSQDQMIGDLDEDEDDDEGATADDRLANKFRKEFETHVRDKIARNRARARQRQANVRPGDPARKGDGDVLRGPKLGGSRNDRAQMRDILLRQEKESQGRR